MEFKELVQSVFSAVYLEGRPVECSDHQVHTWCLPVAVLYTADSLARLCTVSRALTPLVLCGPILSSPTSAVGGCMPCMPGL